MKSSSLPSSSSTFLPSCQRPPSSHSSAAGPFLPPCSSTILPSPSTDLHQHQPPSSASVQPPPQDTVGAAAFSAGKRAAAAPSTQPAPFLTKTFDLVDNKDTDAVISWNSDGDGLVIWDAKALCQSLLQRYFRHGNFASFIRQLNIYGFRKIASERWEFGNCNFLRGQWHLLGRIHRKRSAMPSEVHNHHHHHHPELMVGSSSSGAFSCDSEAMSEAGKLGIRANVNVLKHEIHRLRQRLEHAEWKRQAMWQLLQVSSKCEQIMMSFVGKATRDPSFLSELAQKCSPQILEEARSQKPMEMGIADQSKVQLMDQALGAQDEADEEASWMMAICNQITEGAEAQANEGSSWSPTAASQSSQRNDACGIAAPSLYLASPRSESISVCAAPQQLRMLQVKAEQESQSQLLHKDAEDSPSSTGVYYAASKGSMNRKRALCFEEVDGASASSASTAQQLYQLA